MKRMLIAVVTLATPALLAAQEYQRITLDEAVRLAHLNATQMRGANNTVRQREQTLTQRYASLLPSISTSASIRPAQNGNNANFNAGISMGLNSIFDYNTYFQLGQAKRQLEVSERQLVQTRYQVAATVKQQFFSALQSEEQLVIARNQLAVADTQYKRTSIRVREGLNTGSDSLAAQISVFNARISVSSAENNVRNAYETLSRTLNVEYLVRPDTAGIEEFRFVQIDSAQLFAWLQDSPAIRTEEAGIEDAKYSLRTAKLQYLPRPSGSLSFSRSGQGQGFFGFDDQQYRYSGGDVSLSFSISLQIFNGFSREMGLVNARTSLRFAEEDYQILQRTQAQDLARRIRDLRLLEEQYRVSELSVVSAEENLRQVQLRFENDLVTTLEVINAQNSLFSARNSLINMRYSYRNQIAQLEQLLGRDIR